MRFDAELQFDFFTFKPYNFEEDTYECYIDYSQPFLTLYLVNGAQHNLTNLDIIYMNNFAVPGIIAAENATAPTYR